MQAFAAELERPASPALRGMADPIAYTEAPAGERRGEPRRPVEADLWIIDHLGATILHCRSVDLSASGVRLSVPQGYGVAEGQRYEFWAHVPGETPRSGRMLFANRWGTILRVVRERGGQHVEVGVRFDDGEPVGEEFAQLGYF